MRSVGIRTIIRRVLPRVATTRCDDHPAKVVPPARGVLVTARLRRETPMSENSSSARWMWSGEANPLGARSSSAVNRPSVCSPVALSRANPRLNHSASPSPGDSP